MAMHKLIYNFGHFSIGMWSLVINLLKIKYFIFTYDLKHLNDAKLNKRKVIITLLRRNDLSHLHHHYVTTYKQKQNIVNQTLQILNPNFVIHLNKSISRYSLIALVVCNSC